VYTTPYIVILDIDFTVPALDQLTRETSEQISGGASSSGGQGSTIAAAGRAAEEGEGRRAGKEIYS